MRKFFAAAAVAAIGLATAAHADFAEGMQVSVTGLAYPEFGGTIWGTGADQGMYTIGSQQQYFDMFFPFATLEVTSFVIGTNIAFEFDYSNFFPGDFTTHEIEILDLKTDGSIIKVVASQGTISTDGNSIHWIGSGADLAANPVLTLEAVQVPAPGALALVGLAGLVARRRRA